MSEQDKIRIDKYLWGIRMYKTRSLATDAIDRGKVSCNGLKVKPSKTVHIGEVYELKMEGGITRTVEVTALIAKRQSYEIAIKHYIDKTPEEEKIKLNVESSSFHTGKRLSKIGRPTKKERRNLGDYLDF
jgi:ribosome-associated heat shock protein Hsp15